MADTNWKNSLVTALCKRTGLSSPFEGVRLCVQRLINDSGIQHPPFCPEVLGHLRSIRNVIAVPLEVDGRLLPDGTSYTVEVNCAHSKQRQNFSCAHELIHTFFLEPLEIEQRVLRMRNYPGSPNASSSEEEEILCNYGASELLMPIGFFDKRAACLDPSFYSITCLAREFDVSIEAAARRWIKVSQWRAILIKWTPTGPEERRTLGLLWSKSTKGIRSHISPAAEPPEQVRVAYSHKTGLHGRVRLSLGGPEDDFFMESIWLGGSQNCVFSLIVLEPSIHLFPRSSKGKPPGAKGEARSDQMNLSLNRRQGERRVPDFLKM